MSEILPSDVTPSEAPQGIVGRVGSYVVKAIAFVAGLNLFLMMALTAVAVFMRYFMNKPVPGDTELVEFMMAIFVPLSVAYCAARHQHIAVDIFVEKMPRRMQGVFGVFTSSLVIFFYAVLTWQTWEFIIEEAKSHTTTAVLLIPTYPFIAPLVIMGIVVAVVMAHHLIFTDIKGVFKK